jgi:DNA-binding Lrp family transcriptional regulator
MPRRPRTKEAIIGALADGKPHTHRDIANRTGLSNPAVWNALLRLWRGGIVLRTPAPIRQHEKIHKGRAGTSRTLVSYHLYLIKPEGTDHHRLEDNEFVSFSEEYLDARGKGKRGSKAGMILEFLEKNKNKAFFSREIADALGGKGVEIRDIMPNIKRFADKGLVYYGGYRSGDRQTPYPDGYLITWLDPGKPRERAIEEAVERGETALERKGEKIPHYQRVHRIWDVVVEETKSRRIVSAKYLQSQLGCTDYETERALKRALEHYPEIKQVKLFDAYRYFYHSSMSEERLNAVIKMEENRLRSEKGSAYRIGHNWEAVSEWFIETFTGGADFWEQKHREKGMDARRITLFLFKNVGKRRNKAEVDRVWEVKTSPFSAPTINVLSCKWGQVSKDAINDFFEVLRWSKEFGVNTPDGRQLKQGVVGMFAASTFDPREKVKLKDETEISLPEYARRMNVTLIKAADLNERLHEWGCPMEVTVQKICKWARDEKEVRETLSAVRKEPQKAEEILEKVRERNIGLYQFERRLEGSGKEEKVAEKSD